ncbi:zinc finger protein CONSTANS-LIKE 16-like [Diospyros lotus]|uniref:zinc finger protein CONSTANS-LIKE 16-like n=1 Tax=Diospyros lotus TaxID=55363 RepID=UPI002251A623|nr:zinc finger protein CONSTANS-LIKE 16-like [Diospyros lotus]
MASTKKLANAVGGKTARACDSCLRRRARLYCTADDAFLCQACDASVHSANSLASRHERVRLKTSSFKSSEEPSNNLKNFAPSWHQGFTRKARTPRHGKQPSSRQLKSEEPIRNSHVLVPELASGETSNEENEEQLLYRVPTFDPFVASDSKDKSPAEIGGSSLHGFLPSEMELAEFAANVESLLGKGLDEESFNMEALGLLDCKEKGPVEASLDGGRVKVEDEEDMINSAMDDIHVDGDIDMSRETFEFNFDYGSPAAWEEEENRVIGCEGAITEESEENKADEGRKTRREILLRLDYQAIITAWDNQRSPWTTGDRPELTPSDCWPEYMGGCRTVHNYQNGEMGTVIGGGGPSGMGDGGREARVSRYREKRRTRLFSKKIRYEVRKLNAEKRPRMKGRFVKRANFAASPVFPLLNNK